MTHDTTDIGRQVLDYVKQANTRCTPAMIRTFLAKSCFLSRSDSRRVLRDLMEEGRLEYRYEFGCTFVSLPLLRPMRLGERVAAIPAGQSPGNEFVDDHCIYLNHGQAFGGGDHPTTRLAIAGMEVLAARMPSPFDLPDSRQLDIGTGSGILLMTGIRFGIMVGVGTDIDACARFEARENSRLNGMEPGIRILERAPEDPAGGYALVTANLRYPTLLSMQTWIERIVSPGGAAVLSGIRDEELDGLKRSFGGGRLKPVWEAVQSGWATLVLSVASDRQPMSFF